MSVFELASTIGSVCLAATRLLKVATPLWAKLPKVVAAVIPVFILALPQVAALVVDVKTELDFTQFLVMAAALLVPGVEDAINRVKNNPNVPPQQ